MTADKLTAAGIKTPWPLKMHRRLTYMDASPELRLKWASKAIDALVDLLVQTTRELRLSNRMHAKLTDKHTEASCVAERAAARIAELEAENERLKERCDAYYERRLPCREAEVAQKRYEEAEANAEFYERRAVEAERDSDKQYKLRAQGELDRNELQERVDDLLATLAVTEAERDKLRAENERLKTRTNIALAALYRPDCRPDLAWKVLAHTLWEDDQDD